MSLFSSHCCKFPHINRSVAHISTFLTTLNNFLKYLSGVLKMAELLFTLRFWRSTKPAFFSKARFRLSTSVWISVG